MWVANSSTLICGERDPFSWTLSHDGQSQTLLNWIVASGKNLHRDLCNHDTAIILWASIASGAFPARKAVATPEVVKAMHEHLSPTGSRLLARLFPGEIPDRLLVADAEDES